MYPVTPVRGAVGQRLAVLAGSATSFALDDYANNLIGVTTYDYTMDWGDGSVNSGVRTPVALTTSHAWSTPGQYTVQLQTVIAGAVQTFSWNVLVAWTRTDFAVTQRLPWVATVQTTLKSQIAGTRHLILLVPGQTNLGEPGLAPGAWGAEVALALTEDVLIRACDDAVLRWQSAYANGFGRIAMPAARLPVTVAAAFSMDAIQVGSTNAIEQTGALVERSWREIADDPAGGLFLPPLVTQIQSWLTRANTTPLADLTPMPWTNGDFLTAGEKSVQMAAVMRWTEYKLQEIDDNQTAANVPVWSWRRQTQQADKPAPTPDMGSAWAWEVAQAASQVTAAFFAALDATDGLPYVAEAMAAVFANPATGVATLRIGGGNLPFWLVLQAAPASRANEEIAVADMAFETGGGRGGFVAARAFLVANTAVVAPTMPPYQWDVGRASAIFDGNVGVDAPVLQAAPAGTVTLMTEQTGQETKCWLMPDGARRRAATVAGPGTDQWTTVDVVRPAMALPDPATFRGGMRPHAVLAVLAGAAGLREGSGVAGLSPNSRMRQR